jgi:hypothetical protein
MPCLYAHARTPPRTRWPSGNQLVAIGPIRDVLDNDPVVVGSGAVLDLAASCRITRLQVLHLEHPVCMRVTGIEACTSLHAVLTEATAPREPTSDAGSSRPTTSPRRTRLPPDQPGPSPVPSPHPPRMNRQRLAFRLRHGRRHVPATQVPTTRRATGRNSPPLPRQLAGERRGAVAQVVELDRWDVDLADQEAEAPGGVAGVDRRAVRADERVPGVVPAPAAYSSPPTPNEDVSRAVRRGGA